MVQTAELRDGEHTTLGGWFHRAPDRRVAVQGEVRRDRAWHSLRREDLAAHHVGVELRPESTVWVRVKGRLTLAGAEELTADLREALRRTQDRLVLDLRRLLQAEPKGAESIAEGLKGYRDRIRVVVPATGEMAPLAALFALYS